MATEAMRLGRYEEAFHYYRRAIEMDGNNAAHYMHLGDAYAYADQPARALAYYQRAMRLNPRDPEPYFALGGITADLDATTPRLPTSDGR